MMMAWSPTRFRTNLASRNQTTTLVLITWTKTVCSWTSKRLDPDTLRARSTTRPTPFSFRPRPISVIKKGTSCPEAGYLCPFLPSWISLPIHHVKSHHSFPVIYPLFLLLFSISSIYNTMFSFLFPFPLIPSHIQRATQCSTFNLLYTISISFIRMPHPVSRVLGS